MSKILLLLSLKRNCDAKENLAVKRKLRYYKEVINPNLEYQKYLSVLTSSLKKINIAKIRTNSHELHSKTRHCSIPKTPWEKRVFHLCDFMSVEDESHFLLEFLIPTLYMSFIVFDTIQTFIISQLSKTIMSLEIFLASFLSTGTIF